MSETKKRKVHTPEYKAKVALEAMGLQGIAPVLPIDSTQRSIGLPVANTIFLASLLT